MPYIQRWFNSTIFDDKSINDYTKLFYMNAITYSFPYSDAGLTNICYRKSFRLYHKIPVNPMHIDREAQGHSS